MDEPTPEELEQSFALAYDYLRDLAGRMRSERGEHSLQPTALVHEAAVRLLKADRLRWKDEAHFRAIAARAMRQVLMDRARWRRAQRHGRGWNRVTLGDLGQEGRVLDVLILDDVLTELEELDPRGTQVAVLKVFGELDEPEIARILGLSVRTVRRDWRVVRAWLMARLEGEDYSPGSRS